MCIIYCRMAAFGLYTRGGRERVTAADSGEGKRMNLVGKVAMTGLVFIKSFIQGGHSGEPAAASRPCYTAFSPPRSPGTPPHAATIADIPA